MSPAADLAHVETWVFDMDNTLYCPSLRLFDQVSARITAYVMEALAVDRAEAERLRALYWREHGTTLAGLMALHAVDPDPFLAYVHEIDLSAVTPDLALRDAIAALPGRKVVYTNGSRAHGRGLAAALGLTDCFAAVYGVEDAGYVVKPHRPAFEAVFARDGLDPLRAAMVEDDQRNLRVPAAMGMRAIWRPADPAEPAEPHVHHVARDLAAFLAAAR
jgi:putative hydrolase of the HAD superfamily